MRQEWQAPIGAFVRASEKLRFLFCGFAGTHKGADGKFTEGLTVFARKDGMLI